jgi:hypothetical protein
LAIEPANIVLVTVPVSVVYTPFVTVPAFPPIDKLATAVVEATVKGAVPVATVEVTVVNLPVLAAVPPIAGGLDRSNVPPSVTVPVVVIGPPVKVMPFIVPAVATEVTEPEPLLLKVFQSVDVKYPLTDVVAAAMLIAGVVPPEDTTGAVPVTLATTPVTPEIEPPVIATALAS